jgi:hypothetical protein
MPREFNFPQLTALRIFNVDLSRNFVRSKIDNWNFLLEFNMARWGKLREETKWGKQALASLNRPLE